MEEVPEDGSLAYHSLVTTLDGLGIQAGSDLRRTQQALAGQAFLTTAYRHVTGATTAVINVNVIGGGSLRGTEAFLERLFLVPEVVANETILPTGQVSRAVFHGSRSDAVASFGVQATDCGVFRILIPQYYPTPPEFPQ